MQPFECHHMPHHPAASCSAACAAIASSAHPSCFHCRWRVGLRPHSIFPLPPPAGPSPPATKGITLTKVQLLGLLVAVLVVSGLLNLGSARLMAYVTTLGAMWHLIALAAFCLTVGLVANKWQSAEVRAGGRLRACVRVCVCVCACVRACACVCGRYDAVACGVVA